MYETSHVRLLRLYIATKRKVTPDEDVESCSAFPESESGTSSDEFTHVPVAKKRQKQRSKQGTAKVHKTPEEKKRKVKSHKHHETRIPETPPLDLKDDLKQSRLIEGQLQFLSCPDASEVVDVCTTPLVT